MNLSIVIKRIVRRLCCSSLFIIINGILFMISLTLGFGRKETFIKSSTTYTSFSFDRRTEQSIAQYFEQKTQTQKQSTFKILLPDSIQNLPNSTSILIYEHTPFGGLCRRRNQESIYISNCPFRNCQFTCNSSHAYTADAVLMHYGNLNYERLLHLRVGRNSNQIWLLFHDEPSIPTRIYNRFMFNWTITYRWDSEVSVAAYGVTLLRHVPMTSSYFSDWITENFKRRRNEALWFVNNCSPKKRLQYYHQLKQHFPIIGFGKCIINQTDDSKKCPRGSSWELERLSASKFYLAFESFSTRRDYITEKFWRALSHGAIPVVIGPKRESYERIAPPHSFIYVEDYPDAEKLSKYLTYIGNNPREYEKYHEWRINYETRYRASDLEPILFCELCYKLNTNRNRVWYTDINKFFLEED